MPYQKDFFKDLLDNLSDGVYFVDRERRILYWNRGAERITGYRAEEVVGRFCFDNILMHVSPDGCALCRGLCPLARTIQDGRARENEVFLHHREGHRVPVLVRISPLRDEDGTMVGAVEVFSDNSSKVAALRKIEELQEVALLDPLTQLGNRRYCEITLADKFAEMARFGWTFGVLFMDLDEFKSVNDRYGHEVGDETLRIIAKTLLANTRTMDFIGRWGGEEFLAVIVNVDEVGLVQIAERFKMLVSQTTIEVEGGAIKVTISTGVTLAGPDDTQDSLMRRADALMYRAKAEGRNRVIIGQAAHVEGG